MKKKNKYEILEKEKEFNEKIYITYGIIMHIDNESISLEDVSLCKKYVENIVKKLNEFDVSAVHFKDVVQDFIES